jgi:hypothetical protein
MVGEARRIFAPATTGAVPWAALSGAVDARFHVWFRSWHDLPPTALNASQTSFALDLRTMNKGVAYVNGFNLGRYVTRPNVRSAGSHRCLLGMSLHVTGTG